jgi:hypothetical protein
VFEDVSTGRGTENTGVLRVLAGVKLRILRFAAASTNTSSGILVRNLTVLRLLVPAFDSSVTVGSALAIGLSMLEDVYGYEDNLRIYRPVSILSVPNSACP